MKILFILSLLLFSLNGWADIFSKQELEEGYGIQIQVTNSDELNDKLINKLYSLNPYHLCVTNQKISKIYPCIKSDFLNFDGSIECFSGSKKIHDIENAQVEDRNYLDYKTKDFWENIQEGQIITTFDNISCNVVESTTRDACVDENDIETDMDNCKNKDYKNESSEQ